ncbi:MAG: hypothetical protein IPH45_17890 [Bacteroidales bacterium]|nr:hypothetical protein [Bacteroidales bacterium]
MKKLSVLSLMITISLLTVSFSSKVKTNKLSSECSVAEFYQSIEYKNEVKILTKGGELEEAELILVPTKVDVGTYEISLTKKGSNIYQIVGTGIYVETRSCYDFISLKTGILKVVSTHGLTKGRLILNKG